MKAPGYVIASEDVIASKYIVLQLRFFFGPGYRIYYMIKGNTVVILLTGENKTTQAKDIKKATALLNDLEERKMTVKTKKFDIAEHLQTESDIRDF